MAPASNAALKRSRAKAAKVPTPSQPDVGGTPHRKAPVKPLRPSLAPAEFDWKSDDPEKYAPIFMRRAKMLEAIRSASDRKLLAACHKIYEGDPIRFIEDWMVTYDPRRTPAYMPFLLFDRQREFILWLKDRLDRKEDALIEKSRDMGVTWLCCAFSIWLWTYRPGQKISFGSRKQDLVDKLGDPDSIFEKMRIILRMMPFEFRPPNYEEQNDAPFLRIKNPSNGSTITGEAGDNIGRGGRSTIYFKDESAFYERPDRIEAALSENSDVKIDLSTPNGTGNPFYRKRFGGILPIFTFHWKQDPRKDQVWYDERKRKLEGFILAQEIDIDYNASAEDIIIPAKWVQAAIGLGLKPSSRGVAGLDIAAGGSNKSVYLERWGPVFRRIASKDDDNSTSLAYWAHDRAIEGKVRLLNYDAIGVGVGPGSTLRNIEAEIPEGVIQTYVPYGVTVGDTPTDDIWPDGKSSVEKFVNLKAELWWKLRRRFEKAHQLRAFREGDTENGFDWPEEECVSLPADAMGDDEWSKLVGQLSVVKYFRRENGKIIVESKQQLRARGILSPDHVEAAILSLDDSVEELPAEDDLDDHLYDDFEEHLGHNAIGRELDAVY